MPVYAEATTEYMVATCDHCGVKTKLWGDWPDDGGQRHPWSETEVEAVFATLGWRLLEGTWPARHPGGGGVTPDPLLPSEWLVHCADHAHLDYAASEREKVHAKKVAGGAGVVG